MKIYYTVNEGGKFRPLQVEETKEEIIWQLEANRVNQKHSYLNSFSKSDELTHVFVNAVVFSDNTVWDCFNSIRDAEKSKGFYEQLETLKLDEKDTTTTT